MVLTIFAAWLLADFMSGLVHWAEDKLLTKDTGWSVLVQIKMDNDLHHEKPTAMLKYSRWQNISTTAPITLPLATALGFGGAPLVLVLAVFFATFANLIHRWAHTPVRHLCPLVRVLQIIGLFSSSEQHGRHHFYFGVRISKEDSRRCYCPMSDWLNCALDGIGFWDGMERLVKRRNV